MPFPRIVKVAQVRRDEILDVAQDLFARKGYDATSVADIISTIGVSKGGFYHHFQSKEDLLEAIACRYAQQTTELTRDVMEDPTLDAFSRLIGFLGAIRGQKLRNAAELRATFEPMLRPENLALYERAHRAVTDVVRPLLTRIIAGGVEEQTFDTSDAESAAEAILHLMTFNRDLVAELYRARDRVTFERLSRRLLEKLTFMGTVIDRILGLPEGSVELADRAIFDVLACGLDAPPDAA